MRISVALIAVSVLDFIGFAAVWVWRSLAQTAPAIATVLYFLFGIIGFILSVYGFIVLAKGGEKTLRRAGLLTLFAFIPALAVLIAVLKVVGGHPV